MAGSKRTPISRGRRLSPGRIKTLLMGPESVLVDGGYYRCGSAQIAFMDPAERQAVEIEMKADWQANRANLTAIWRGRAPDLNAESKWYRITRAEGPCWAEVHLDER